MIKLMPVLKWIAVAVILYLHLEFIKFFFIDSCLDRGGRFLGKELMCEAENGFISFNVGPIFYIFSCGLFSVGLLGVLKLAQRLQSRPNSIEK